MAISAAEQYLIELINRARLDPLAEASRYGIDLNAGLTAGTITTSQKQVLAPNTLLESAAQAHSEWLLETDTFSHTGANGSTVTQRIQAAGYTFSGSWSNGENLAFSASTAPIDLGQKITEHHRGLFLSAGHRRNILEESFREIGVAQVSGSFTWNGSTYAHTSMLTEKFASSGVPVFITGVFYSDRNGDGFYSIGEGTSGQVMDGDRSVVAAAAGGYALAVDRASAVTVTVESAGISGMVALDTSSGNAKLDVVDGAQILTSVNTRLISGIHDARLLGVAHLSLTGTASDDRLTGNSGNNRLVGGAGDDLIYGGAGDDTLFGGRGADQLFGGDGHDMLVGNDGDDTLFGGAGNDTLIGGMGYDILDGGNGSDLYMIDDQDHIHDTGTWGYDRAQIRDPSGLHIMVGGWIGVDRVSGFIGDDTIDATGATAAQSLLGGGGNDVLIGGSNNDRLFGGNGNDLIYGGDGHDILIGGDGDDTLYGGAGNDTLVGGQGNNVLDGGEGNDVYMISGQDLIIDTGTEPGNFDRAQINVAGGLSLSVGQWIGVERVSGFTGNDTIDATGATADQQLLGGGGDDVLIGGSGNDQLYGGAGNDRLIGGAGDDYMVGGPGADTFVFREGFGRDVVRDFTRGTDLIEIAAHSAMHDFEALLITQFNNIAVIRAHDTTDEILLVNVHASSLTPDDFVFL